MYYLELQIIAGGLLFRVGKQCQLKGLAWDNMKDQEEFVVITFYRTLLLSLHKSIL